MSLSEIVPQRDRHEADSHLPTDSKENIVKEKNVVAPAPNFRPFSGLLDWERSPEINT